MRVTAITLTNFQSFADSGRIPLHPITLFVGKNNSGKSAIINALSLVQSGLIQHHNELVRVGASQAEILLEAEDLPAAYRLTGNSAACLHLMLPRGGQTALHVRRDDGNGASESRPQFPSDLSGAVMLRLSADNALRIFDERINAQLSRQITADMTNLPALISSFVTVGHPRSLDFADMTSHLFGFHFGLTSTESGQLPGLVIDDDKSIPIASMGSGVIRLARLLVYLMHARRRILLWEEPENDLHPEALRYVLDLVRKVVQDGAQAVITTHSHIVVNTLGEEPQCAVYGLDMELVNGIPTTRVTPCSTAHQRLQLLRIIGHQLADFALFEAYLILEESSAEAIIQRLIAWFTPRLAGRIRTVACYGTQDAVPRFSDLNRLFVFLHLEEMYRGRTWVVLDGDEAGSQVREQLRESFADWPKDHFRLWPEANFERFYPQRFRQQADEVLSQPHDVRWLSKKQLVAKVVGWMDNNEKEAKEEFQISAKPVIDLLREIEAKVVEGSVVPAVTSALGGEATGISGMALMSRLEVVDGRPEPETIDGRDAVRLPFQGTSLNTFVVVKGSGLKNMRINLEVWLHHGALLNVVVRYDPDAGSGYMVRVDSRGPAGSDDDSILRMHGHRWHHVAHSGLVSPNSQWMSVSVEVRDTKIVLVKDGHRECSIEDRSTSPGEIAFFNEGSDVWIRALSVIELS